MDTASLLPGTVVELCELFGSGWCEGESFNVGTVFGVADGVFALSETRVTSLEARDGEIVVEEGEVRFDGSDI